MHVPVMFPPYVSLAEFVTARLCINCIRRLSDGKVENRGRNRYNVEMFLCAYYISAGQTSLLQVQ